MNAGQVFINVWNCHAYVAKSVKVLKGLTWKLALNAEELEAEAALVVKAQGGSVNLSGHYNCPSELAQKAIFAEVATKIEIVEVIHTLRVSISPAIAIFFGGDKLACISWGAIVAKGDKPIGLATVADKGEQGDALRVPAIVGIMVLPEHRRKGLGLALLHTVIVEADKRGLLPLLFEALTPSGLALVQSAGYGEATLTIRNQNLGVEL